jgi:DNA-binding transcriptional LysR family regulator
MCRWHYSRVMNESVLERTGISLERLRNFLLVVEAAGIARAAPGQPVRQSLYSRQIGELEAALELVLFERQGRGLKLTEAGRQLAIVVRDVIRGLEGVALAARLQQQPFSLAAGDSLLHWWILPRLGAHPSNEPVSVQSMSSGDAASAVREGRVDFGVVRVNSDLRGLEQLRLGFVDYAIFASAGLIRGYAERNAELARLPLALQTSEPLLNEGLQASLRAAGRLQPALYCETFPQVCRAVQSGRYAGLLPTLARAELPARRYRELTFGGQAKLRSAVALVWRKKAVATRARGESLVATLAERLTLSSIS